MKKKFSYYLLNPKNLIDRVNIEFNKKSKSIIEKSIRSSKFIWNFGTPKSASTSLSLNFKLVSQDYKKNLNFFQVYSYGKNRQHVIDFNLIKKNYNKKKINITERGHILASNEIDFFIGENHLINITTRNIFDTLNSLINHMDSEFKKNIYVPWDVAAHSNWSTLSAEEKLNRLVFNYLPFHIQFLDSWIFFKKKRNFKSLNFLPFQENIHNIKHIINKQLNDLKFNFSDLDKIEIKKFNLTQNKLDYSYLFNKEIKSKIEKSIKSNSLFYNDLKNFYFE